MPDSLLAKRTFEETGALLTNGHFVLENGHSSVFIARDRIYENDQLHYQLCHLMAMRLIHAEVEDVDVVVGTAQSGIELKSQVASCLAKFCGRPVVGIYALPQRVRLLKATEPACVTLDCASRAGKTLASHEIDVPSGSELILQTPEYVLKRQTAHLVKGKRVVVVVDVISTGQTVKRAIQAVRENGGQVVAVSAIANRGKETAESLGVPKLIVLLHVAYDLWMENKCPMCRAGVPVNTEYGFGQEFQVKKGYLISAS